MESNWAMLKTSFVEAAAIGVGVRVVGAWPKSLKKEPFQARLAQGTQKRLFNWSVPGAPLASPEERENVAGNI